MKKNKPLVAIVMGSDSDLSVMNEAAAVLESFEVPFVIDIVSAHRTPKKMYDFAANAVSEGLKVIIAGAGGAAHLPGMIASLTPLPVIGVPVHSKSLSGIDSLYSIVQMPPGVPVATVAINGAKNAALLAIQILGVANEALLKKIQDYKLEMEGKVLHKGENLVRTGYKKFGAT